MTAASGPTGTRSIYTVYSRVGGSVLFRDETSDSKRTDYLSAGPLSVRLVNGGSPTFTHADHLGSAVAATDAAGAILWRESYRPFGETRLKPAANDNNTGYTGHLADRSTGLVYMQARLYDPLIGVRRFASNPLHRPHRIPGPAQSLCVCPQ